MRKTHRQQSAAEPSLISLGHAVFEHAGTGRSRKADLDQLDRSLALIHNETDDIVDQFRPMQGNTTIFGFDWKYGLLTGYSPELMLIPRLLFSRAEIFQPSNGSPVPFPGRQSQTLNLLRDYAPKSLSRGVALEQNAFRY